MDSSRTEIYLCSKDRYDEYLRMDRSVRSFVIEPGDPLRLGLPLSGVFGRMDVGPVALYREFDGLWLLSKLFSVLLTEQTSAELAVDEKSAERRILRLGAGKALQVNVTYRAESRWADDLQRQADFTFTQDEDFDYGLFIANIINDNEKLNSFYSDRNWSGH